MADEVRYAMVDYDVHNNKRAYPRIYKSLRKVAVMLSESVYIVNLAQAARVHDAFDKIKKDLEEAGIGSVTFDTFEFGERDFEKLRNRSISALTEQVQGIVTTLHKSIEDLEAKFDPKVHDPEDLVKGRKIRVSRAKSALKAAKGVAMLFLIEKNVEDALKATELVIAAEKAMASGPPKTERSSSPA